MSKIKLKFRLEYQCQPIWKVSTDCYENINPDDLPITDTLKDRIIAWDQKFQKTYNTNDPTTPFISENYDEDENDKEAYLIYSDLIEELGDRYEVEFYFYVSSSKKKAWSLP